MWLLLKVLGEQEWIDFVKMNGFDGASLTLWRQRVHLGPCLGSDEGSGSEASQPHAHTCDFLTPPAGVRHHASHLRLHSPTDTPPSLSSMRPPAASILQDLSSSEEEECQWRVWAKNKQLNQGTS
ncbi:hypothetical protein AAFF_G00356720 [Aldrovandia affinis]|uniref:Uncharacterized protein n=1 Tax=Aldrovandia affinis TaxID=143900 RepID=A0AAD7X1W2_9TELE|nr:hypothetical protein AAFF_G00356720 [Aldrovandia affinis]